jgi:transposase
MNVSGPHSEARQAEVMALGERGMTAAEIIAATGLPERTVHRWRARWRTMAENQDPELASQDYRVSARAGYLQEDWLDVVEAAAPNLTLKEWQPLIAQLSITRGIAQDKLLKRREAAQTNVNINVILEQREKLRQQLDTPTFDASAELLDSDPAE